MSSLETTAGGERGRGRYEGHLLSHLDPSYFIGLDGKPRIVIISPSMIRISTRNWLLGLDQGSGGYTSGHSDELH